MNHQKKRYFHFFLGITVSVFVAFLFFSVAQTALAQADGNTDVFGTQDIEQNVALGGNSLQKTVVRIINVALGLLGIIALGIVLYGGYIYMTSGGSEEKIAEAKKILVNGTIGLAIILSAWAITSFVLNRLGEATGVRGLGNDIPSACRNPEFANDNPDQCFGNGDFDIPGGENVDCALRNRKVLLTRGITPSQGPSKTPTGMNNVKVRVLFNNPLLQNDARQIFTLYRIENNQEVAVTDSFDFRFSSEDPALLEATFRGQNGLDQLPQGEYKVKVNKDLKGRNNQNLVERVACGEFPSEASFTVDTEGVIDNQAPVAGPVTLNGRQADPQGEQLNRGRVNTFLFNVTDNSGIGVIHYHVTVTKEGREISQFDSFDIPRVSRGSAATDQDPFVTKLPLILPANTELFTEYSVLATVFDIDGNSVQVRFQGIVVGAACRPGDNGSECLDDDRACTSDLQCPSKKCVNNQCVPWPVITNINGESGVWDGAAGNFVTVEGDYFGEVAGHVYFGYEDEAAVGGVRWVEALLPVCSQRDVWHDEWIIVAVPGDDTVPIGKQAIIKVERAREANQNEALFDTTIDNHGPIPGPNRGRFTKNDTKRPGICSVGVAAGHPTIPRGATQAPPNTSLEVLGTAFGVAEQGTVRFGTAQAEAEGWSDDGIRTRIPANMKAGIVGISVTQNGIVSNHFPFVVSSTLDTSRPTIISIDPVTTTRRSYITIVGRGFGEEPGEVFLAPDATTDCRPEGRFNAEICKKMDTRTCGETWSRTQIIAQVPEDIAFKNWVVRVERSGDLVTSQDQTLLGVEDGAPNPGICFFKPSSGPAPLPENSAGLKFRGINFSDTPKIYFWPKGANEKDVNSWLVQQGDKIHTVDAESQGGILTVTTSIPVVNGITLSKGPAPIRIKNANGGVSNAVVYTVDDCRESAPLDGYQCCSEGPDAGFFKPNNQICKGQVRDAGYAWRFTTGRIPEMPQVAERCATSTPDGEPPVFPSPAPWQNWLRNDLACVNQSVVVAFRLPEGASLINVNPNTVKIFKCAEDNGAPDCAGNKKVPVAYDDNDMQLDANSYLTIIANPLQGPSQLEPNTWYHVELSKTIQSLRQIPVAGGQQEERVGLLVKRSCSNDTAYCFDFKTGSAENRCTLDRVGVIPHPFRVDYLGVLQLPGFYDPTRIMDPLASTTLYYKVWGTGSQDCSVVDVRGLGWNWSTNEREKATAVVTERNDAKAIVTSLGNTVPETVKIQAHAVVDQENKDGEADLIIDLGEPKVTDFWPSCTESCIEAGLGVRFNRQMFQSSFTGNIKLYKCVNELCNDPVDAFVATDSTGQDYFTYRFAPNSGKLDKDSWYKVVVGEGVQGLGSLGENQEVDHPEDDAGGKFIQEFTWRFRTTAAPDGNCIADKVVLEPKNFVARQIGERTQYNARPRTAANKCSKLGQDLNPWVYGWDWKVVTPDTNNAAAAGHEVAEITTYSLQGKIKPYCGLTCLPLGSDTREIPNGRYPVCGDGIVGPGEDCDLGVQNAQGGLQEVPGVSCMYNCLRPGNKNAGDDAGQAVCGNGVVNTLAGEECDPGDPEQRSFCTNICTHKGSGSRLDNATTTAWCGSGDVANGEECDIESMATSTSQGRIGCSNQCLHVGSALSQDWCTRHAEEQYGDTKVKDKSECAAAISICGNGVLEIGEECERRLDGGAGIQAALDIERRESVNVPNAGPGVCSNTCLLQNICGLNAIPTRANGGPRCEAGTQGCTDGCHVAGSSVTYNTPSFCGDSVPGLGEYPLCEYRAGEANNPPSLGQNPVQMVTAVGLGDINNQSRMQEADIIAQLKNMRGENKEVKPSPNQPVGREEYALQCGFTEGSLQGGSILAERDGSMEAPGTAAWTLVPHNGQVTLVAEKNIQEKSEGNQSLHVTGRGLMTQNNLPLEPGKIYEFSFDYKFVDETSAVSFLVFPFEAGDPLNFAIDEDDPTAEERERRNIITVTTSSEWKHHTRVMTIPANANGPYGISFILPESANLYLDNVSLKESGAFVGDLSSNDCPNNVDNGFGVGTNSCCYPRAHRVASIPEPLATGVCRNAYISVDFNEYITESSLQNNVILVSGHEAGHRCAAGEADLTLEVTSLLEAFDPDLVKADQPGLLRRMWTSIKHFFVRIFGLQNALAAGGDFEVWCSHPNALVPTLSYTSEPDFSATTTTVALALQEALLEDTAYVLLLKGGHGGIADVRGVGIRSNNPKLNDKYLFTDFIAFKTGYDICRINHVEVDPGSYLFVKPNTTSTFEAKVVSDNNQFISPLPVIYNWTWSWVPQNNPIFSIPVPNTTSTESSIIIGSKNVEGTITASALARVIKDVSLVDRHEGRVFSEGVELNADFCDNPWPPRDFYPFEEGVTFGKTRNKNGVNDDGVFNGSELPAIRIGDPVNGTDAYFNVSFSYCADANRTGTTTDDLPYLKPLMFGDLVKGVCTVPGAQAAGDDEPIFGGAFNPGGGRPNDNDLFDLDDPFEDFDFPNLFGGAGPNAMNTCSLDSQCESVSRNAVCRTSDVDQDPTLSGDVLKKFLFINDKNDDAIGFQIVANPKRFSAHQWYENEFPGSNLASIRDITMAGYDAVTDGKSYYVNALNQSGGPTSGVYNNIYILSINNTAHAETQKVFEQILSSLKFNINVSDVGYCLAAPDHPFDAHQTLRENFNRLTEITSTACLSDFDCRNPDGSLADGKNGVCSNAKTKLLRDWDRLNDIRLTQKKLDVYKTNSGSFPQFAAGSFMVGYTNSRWGSWNLLGQAIGGAPVDPINLWSKCGDVDPQTCWNAASSTVSCPLVSSILEYSVSSSTGYLLHSPLEYFSFNEPLNPVIQEFVPNVNQITTEPWCTPNAVISAAGGNCGNGVVNFAAGEECDPAGTADRVNEGFVFDAGQRGRCDNVERECYINPDCVAEVQADPGEGGGPIEREVRMGTCVGGRRQVDGDFGQCPLQGTAQRVCTDQCKWQYGSCQVGTTCGNGRVEGNESCDSGNLNGSYGHCNSECTAPFADFCGNGRIDRDGNRAIEACEYVPNLSIVYMGNFGDVGNQSVRLALNGLLKVQGVPTEEVCGRSNYIDPVTNSEIHDLNAAWCAIVKNGMEAKIARLDTFVNKRCSRDKSLVCENSIDCEGPDKDTFYNFATQSVDRLSNVMVLYRLLQNGRINTYGECEVFSNGTSYSQYQNLSCNGTCSGVAEYCGDGKVQESYENCDDGNTRDNDGCNKYCRSEGQPPVNPNAPAVAAGGCGNSRVDAGEACDLGGANGRACTPAYGRSCTYCKSDCTSVLTVDPSAFCGDNIFQQGSERCDIVNGEIVSTTPNGVTHCPTNFKGDYSCKNQCSLVENTCVRCTSKPMNQGATLSQVYFLNPLTNSRAELVDWETNNGGNPHNTLYQVYAKREEENNGRQVVIDTGRALIGPPFYLSSLYTNRIHSAGNANYENLFGDDDLGLVANQLCSSEYGVVFNVDNMNDTPGTCVGFDSCEAEDYVNLQKASFFPFPFNITGNAIRNEIVTSPPVPLGYIRVVLRTSRADADGALGYKFQLGVYNRGFDDRQKMHQLSEAVGGGYVCDTLRLGGHNNEHLQYWFPDCTGDEFIQDSVYIHPEVGGTESNTIIQSMTIKLNGGHAENKRNYGFFVEASNAIGRVPMGSLTDHDIYVDVYTHVPAASPRYSLYKPTHTYSIKNSATGNQLGKYWHVFNYESANLNAEHPQYGIRSPHRLQWDADAQRNRDITFPGGKIATNDNDFYCYIGGEHCNQE